MQVLDQPEKTQGPERPYGHIYIYIYIYSNIYKYVYIYKKTHVSNRMKTIFSQDIPGELPR